MLSLIFAELTVQEIIADLPHDGGAVVVLALMLAFVFFIWHGSRDREPKQGAPSSGDVRATPAAREAAAETGRVAEPAGEPVLIHPSTLSTAPDVRRLHPEVR